MAERLQKNINITADLTGVSWVYQDLKLNDAGEFMDLPRSLILTNKSSDLDYQVKIIPYDYYLTNGDGSEGGDSGLLLKQDGQIQLQTASGTKHYRVGVIPKGSSASAQVLVVSLSDFIRVQK